MTRRTERINDLIRQEISELIRQAKDRRLSSLVTVTEVVTSPDLRHAKVFVSVMGSEAEKRDTLKGLVAAAGFFRKNLAMRLAMRRIPQLEFRHDDSIERGSHLLDLIRQVSREPRAESDPGEPGRFPQPR
ncbi:MAG TPA: 30S ribosome-binding factor RbfA [Dehalococcoidia bacterium]|nr:30S ribosome-binding factor RbfA [Dehalococcoidia bacterium]